MLLRVEKLSNGATSAVDPFLEQVYGEQRRGGVGMTRRGSVIVDSRRRFVATGMKIATMIRRGIGT